MTALISAPSAQKGWNWRRNRGLALTASGWFAALSVFDLARRTECGGPCGREFAIEHR